jgi:hypothetical protein
MAKLILLQLTSQLDWATGAIDVEFAGASRTPEATAAATAAATTAQQQ